MKQTLQNLLYSIASPKVVALIDSIVSIVLIVSIASYAFNHYFSNAFHYCDTQHVKHDILTIVCTQINLVVTFEQFRQLSKNSAKVE